MLAAAVVAVAGGGDGDRSIAGDRRRHYRSVVDRQATGMPSFPCVPIPVRRHVKNRDRKLRERRLKGLVVLQGFEGGPREWKGRPLYDPETGEGAAKGTLTLRPDGKLEVKGCKATIFYRTKVWTKGR